MKTEKMNELAKDFLREYSFCYKLDLLELVDCEELTKAIDTLEAEECKYFMDKHNINVLEFSQFRQAVQNNLEEFINEERDLLNKIRSDRQHVITKFINEVDNHKNFEQNDLLIKELYQIINNMPLEEFVDYISEYATIHNNPYFMENLNEEESLREAGILKEELLDEMKNHYSFLINNSNNDLNETESAISNENGALESTFDQNKIEKFMDDLIAEIPFDKLEDAEDTYIQIEKRLIDFLKKKNVNNQTLKEAVAIFKRKYEKSIPRLDYYQKVVNVFNTFDFDHLTDEEKKDLLQDIKNGEFISNETQANLNITDKELKNIQNDLLTKLEDISDNNEEVKKSVITKYLNAIKNADESYFELLQSVLTIEKIRENEQNVACLSDEEISSLINEIKEKGIEITLSKILELPEVVAFVNPLLEKIEQAKTLEEINQVEEELINFANSKQMLGLTDFNKNLLVNKLQSLISEQKKVIGFKEKTDEFLSEWREHIKDTETKDLMSLYDEFDRFTKKDIGLKDIDDEELNILKDILKDYVLDELALRIYNDLGGPEEENLDIIKDKVAKMTKEDFEKYNISEDLKDEIVKRLNDRIKKTKTARQEIDQEVAEILEIGTKVTLTKDVPVYENEKCYDEDQQLNENLIKANTKGKITGYVVKKDDSIIVLNSKEDLKNHFKQGYNIIGYEYNYKRLFKNNYTYVELDDVMPIKQKDQKKWSIKKILMTITLAMATMLAATGVFKGYQKNKDRNASPRVAIENETPELNNCINVDGEMVELDEEVIDTLNKMPSTESNWRITEDARIFANADEVGKTKGQTSYFNTHKEYDLDRTFGGYVLKDQDGNTLICMDRNEAFHLIADDNYEYIGIRGLNKYSKNDQDYEGIFTDDSIFNEDSLLNELQEKGVSRRLTK